MAKYKWNSPYEWLADAVNHRTHSRDEIFSRLMNLARNADSDSLQDEFEDLMDIDGYFDKE